MAAHDVTELVAEDVATLFLVEQRDRRRVEHDERLVEADGGRVHERRLRDVEVGALGPVECLDDLAVQRVQRGALLRSDEHRVREEELAHAFLAEEARDLSHDLIEAGDGAKAVERGAVGRVLPGRRGDLGEDFAVSHVWDWGLGTGDSSSSSNRSVDERCARRTKCLSSLRDEPARSVDPWPES